VDAQPAPVPVAPPPTDEQFDSADSMWGLL
jgi:hypothetical protein